MINTDSQKIKEILSRGVEKLIVQEDIEKKLKSGKQLRVKYGIDPTTKDLHLGHAVIYEKLRELQKMGHKIIFLIGDFTARFGDPTQKLETRKMRSKKEVLALAKDYIKQISKILDIRKTEIRYNGEWYDKMSAEDLLRLASHFTYARIIERDIFQQRIKADLPIGLHELYYPVLQAYDSVVLKSDLTVIGTDQIFNELCARQLQEQFNQEPQDLLAMKILIGTDGKQKMSQSLGNYIAFNDKAEEQYGKIMSIPDHLIIDYFELVTRLPMDEIKQIKDDIENGRLNPRDAKARLAREIVKIYYNERVAQKAQEEFEKIFKAKQAPSEMPEIKIEEKKLPIIDLLTKIKMAFSKSQAKRLVEQGGVKINGQTIKDWKEIIEIKDKMIIQVGRRKFVRIKTR